MKRLLTLYRNRYAGCRPVQLANARRRVKLWRYWWNQNGLTIVLVLYLVAVYAVGVGR